MRTTVELPPELLRAAKARSAERGESLKSLLARAVAAELQVQSIRAGQQARVRLPLFGDSRRAAIRLSNTDLERTLASDDAASAGPASQPSRPRRKRR